jgi:DNA-binding GntR family transcriptional regulator
MKISVHEHERIIDAFRKKDPEAAEKLVRINAEYCGRVLIDGGVPPTQAAEFKLGK